MQTQKPKSQYLSTERKRGRRENRKVQVYPITKGDNIFGQWKGLKVVIMVNRYGYRQNKPYNKAHYYISSIKGEQAEYYAKGIRAHWGIENRLHWVKDVILHEDRNRIKTGSIAQNLSLIKSVIINVFRLNGQESIKKSIEKYANRPKAAMILLNAQITY